MVGNETTRKSEKNAFNDECTETSIALRGDIGSESLHRPYLTIPQSVRHLVQSRENGIFPQASHDTAVQAPYAMLCPLCSQRMRYEYRRKHGIVKHERYACDTCGLYAKVWKRHDSSAKVYGLLRRYMR